MSFYHNFSLKSWVSNKNLEMFDFLQFTINFIEE